MGNNIDNSISYEALDYRKFVRKSWKRSFLEDRAHSMRMNEKKKSMLRNKISGISLSKVSIQEDDNVS